MYSCEKCSTRYVTKEEAEKCEARAVINTFKRGMILKGTFKKSEKGGFVIPSDRSYSLARIELYGESNKEVSPYFIFSRLSRLTSPTVSHPLECTWNRSNEPHIAEYFVVVDGINPGYYNNGIYLSLAQAIDQNSLWIHEEPFMKGVYCLNKLTEKEFKEFLKKLKKGRLSNSTMYSLRYDGMLELGLDEIINANVGG